MKIKRLVTSLVFGLGLTLGLLWLMTGGSILPVYANTYDVTNTNDSGAGSLRQAIIDANNHSGPDTIEIDDSLSGQIVLESELPALTGTLTINGPGPEQLAVSGDNSFRVFKVDAYAVVTITDITIRDGNAFFAANDEPDDYGAYNGGGIWSAGDLLHLDNVHILNNETKHDWMLGGGLGGGIWFGGLTSVRLSINGGKINNNRATAPGMGVAAFGGGIYVDLGSATISGTEIAGNSAFNSGGGVHNHGTMNMNGGEISNNSAGIEGGG